MKKLTKITTLVLLFSSCTHPEKACQIKALKKGYSSYTFIRKHIYAPWRCYGKNDKVSQLLYIEKR